MKDYLTEPLDWYPAASADNDHCDEEVDLDALGNPGGASWAYVAAARHRAGWQWAILDRWLWDDATVLACGPAADAGMGKAHVTDWVRNAIRQEHSGDLPQDQRMGVHVYPVREEEEDPEMSRYAGVIPCPECGSEEHRLEDWDTYVSVICAHCSHKMGELKGRP